MSELTKLTLTENEIENLKFLLNNKNFNKFKDIIMYNTINNNELAIIQCEKNTKLNISKLHDRLVDVENFCNNKIIGNGIMIGYMLGTLTGLTSLLLIPVFEKFLNK